VPALRAWLQSKKKQDWAERVCKLGAANVCDQSQVQWTRALLTLQTGKQALGEGTLQLKAPNRITLWPEPDIFFHATVRRGCGSGFRSNIGRINRPTVRELRKGLAQRARGLPILLSSSRDKANSSGVTLASLFPSKVIHRGILAQDLVTGNP